MTPMPTRSEQLIHVARLFYEKNLSKTAIAVQMKLSVTHVARLIEEARATGVVRIEIGGPRQKSLARDLIEKFSCLRDAVVVGSEIDYTLNTRTLAKTAAEYFDEEIR